MEGGQCKQAMPGFELIIVQTEFKLFKPQANETCGFPYNSL